MGCRGTKRFCGRTTLSVKKSRCAKATRRIKPNRWLTKGEFAGLLGAAIEPHLHLYILLAYYTAARKGAILELTWDRVDFDMKLIDFGQGHGNKRRVPVPIHEALLEPLQEALKAYQTDRVVEYGCKPVGDIIRFKACVRRAGLGKDVTPHVVRHTAATHMAMAGINLDLVARFLGDDPKIVAQVYAKYTPGYLSGELGGLAQLNPDARHMARKSTKTKTPKGE